MASRAVTPPSSPTRWSGSRARTSRHYASRQAPTRSPPSSRRPTTSWLRPTPTVTCPLHLLLRRRELLRILILRTWVNKPPLSMRPASLGGIMTVGDRPILTELGSVGGRRPTRWQWQRLI